MIIETQFYYSRKKENLERKKIILSKYRERTNSFQRPLTLLKKGPKKEPIFPSIENHNITIYHFKSNSIILIIIKIKQVNNRVLRSIREISQCSDNEKIAKMMQHQIIKIQSRNVQITKKSPNYVTTKLQRYEITSLRLKPFQSLSQLYCIYIIYYNYIIQLYTINYFVQSLFIGGSTMMYAIDTLQMTLNIEILVPFFLIITLDPSYTITTRYS
eukprot:TRINITY_DN8322_c0_g1_i1.p3 TRINITY_DN8322_c0_g1~~TRINITY_DN8322_c0_g1_i1.p3  ORF type:complete len:215 (-),score=-21.94 TRINITY_DN8322_c0_g1_i1:412-1056(-)